MWNEWMKQHKGKCLGAMAGILFGFIYLKYGLWDMFIFAFIVYVGYYIGKRFDHDETISGIEHAWHWLMERWNMFR